MNSRPLPVEEGWATVLEPVADRIHSMGDFLREENASGRGYLPAGNDVLRAFTYPFDEVKVIIVGQDPYPTPGHAMGLSFSTAPGVRPPEDGDLTPWSEQGVALFNRVLSVQPGKAGSHRGRGWEEVTEHALRALAGRGKPLVAILWGRDAQNTQKFLGDTACICSPHPSPLSAARGFFGSKPFSHANELLVQQGAEPVNWQL